MLARYSLKGVQHTLKEGEIVGGADNGGTGAYYFGAIYRAGQNALEELELSVGHAQPSMTPEEVIALVANGVAAHGRLSRFVYGVAAPVNNNTFKPGIHTLHGGDGNALSSSLGFPVQFRNDYYLVGGRLLADDPTGYVCWQPGLQTGLTTIASAAGPGSGLGLVRVTTSPKGERFVEPLESHGPLAVRYKKDAAHENAVRLNLLPWWRDKVGEADNDAVLCAGGLTNLFRYLVEVHHRPTDAALAVLLNRQRDADPKLSRADRKLLTQRAADKSSQTCQDTWWLFMDLLGTYCQQVAFLHGRRQAEDSYALYLAGGVMAGLLEFPQLDNWAREVFRRAFLATRLLVDRAWLESVAIRVFQDPHHVAKHGAAILAACMEV